MSFKWKITGWLVVVAILAGAFIAARRLHTRERTVAITGAVVRQNADLRKEIPIADVRISAAHGLAASDYRSDSSGFFRVALGVGVKQGQTVTLIFRHPGYEPLEVNEIVGDKLYVVRMVPITREADNAAHRRDVMISNVHMRYSVKTTATVNVGSVVRTFQAVNTGNVPCNVREPCSPDGKWKAAMGSISLDAGQANRFRNARAACIAGPCPFTRIESSNYSHGDRNIDVSALDWSDTATFLVEVEVIHSMFSNISRESYPETFGGALNFTLPMGAEAVSLEAEMDGTRIVFPLGPTLMLSWAECNVSVNSDQTKAFRCELKPGYQFQDHLEPARSAEHQ